MNENTEAQTYMQPKAQFQNTIRELETKLATILERNAKLEEENKKILDKATKIINSFPDIIDCIGGDAPVFVGCDIDSFIQKNLESDETLEATILALKKEIHSFGDYRAEDAIWGFVNRFYIEEMDPESKNRLLSLLRHKYAFPADQVLQFTLNKMTEHKTINNKESVADAEGSF